MVVVAVGCLVVGAAGRWLGPSMPGYGLQFFYNPDPDQPTFLKQQQLFSGTKSFNGILIKFCGTGAVFLSVANAELLQKHQKKVKNEEKNNVFVFFVHSNQNISGKGKLLKTRISVKITALDIHHYLKNNIRRRRSNSPRPARNRPVSDPPGQIRRRNPRATLHRLHPYSSTSV